MIGIEGVNTAQLGIRASFGQGLDAPAPPPVACCQDPPVTDRPARLGVEHREIRERRGGIGVDATKSLAGIICSKDRAGTTDDESHTRIEDCDCREVLGSPGIVFGCEAALGTPGLRDER